MIHISPWHTTGSKSEKIDIDAYLLITGSNEKTEKTRETLRQRERERIGEQRQRQQKQQQRRQQQRRQQQLRQRQCTMR